MAKLDILYFAWVREAIGKAEEQVDPAPGITVAGVIDMLAARGDGYVTAFADRDKLRAALDQNFVPLDTPVGDARELAIFPPVTGG